MTQTFSKLSKSSCKQSIHFVDAFPLVERFTDLNVGSCKMFVKDGRDLVTIPPTSTALPENFKHFILEDAFGINH